MRLSQPRLAPLAPQEWSEEQRELLTRGNPPRVLNVFATLARHPDLFRRWMPFGNHVLFKSSLPAREREMAILRIGWLCRSGYEFHQHTRIGKASGLSDAEIERLKLGPDAPGWTEPESALLHAVDELHADQFIGDGTWQELSKYYDTKQVIDLVFAVGQYTLVSMALNSFGVQIEEGGEKKNLL
ncbi:MAG TPA: carboxymuconolactone decarboxylase family protein [Steroidobacteraceae bacterium]|nr:carboxymuconolactone decarboxylase family protein [Steroidobacteraceae bacterium]